MAKADKKKAGTEKSTAHYESKLKLIFPSINLFPWQQANCQKSKSKRRG
jgi:hypothetical protein